MWSRQTTLHHPESWSGYNHHYNAARPYYFSFFWGPCTPEPRPPSSSGLGGLAPDPLRNRVGKLLTVPEALAAPAGLRCCASPGKVSTQARFIKRAPTLALPLAFALAFAFGAGVPPPEMRLRGTNVNERLPGIHILYGVFRKNTDTSRIFLFPPSAGMGHFSKGLRPVVGRCPLASWQTVGTSKRLRIISMAF